MNFALTEDQQMIRDSAESFLADAADAAAVRKAIESDSGYDAVTWKRIGTELGWCGVAIPEEYGGLGQGPVELVLIQEQIGRRLLCSPFFGTVCLGASFLLHCKGDKAGPLLRRIASGEMIVGAGLSASQPSHVVNPDASLFLIADGADLRAVSAKARRLTTWDKTRPIGVLDAKGGETLGVVDLEAALAHARLYLAAEQLGGAQQCLDSTVAHVSTRKQFGRAIASFQAVKHRCAEMMVRVEAARSMVYGAAALAAGDAATHALVLECSAAKALASETYFFCAQEAIQLHGGVGFTWEYDAQLHFKRAQASGHWMGTAEMLQESIAGALVPV